MSCHWNKNNIYKNLGKLPCGKLGSTIGEKFNFDMYTYVHEHGIDVQNFTTRIANDNF